jgi:hypothetical protein
VLLLVTYTLAYQREESLSEALERLHRARQHATQGRWATKCAARHQVMARVRVEEITYWRNGWHCHSHELLFCQAGVAVGQCQADLQARWATTRDVESRAQEGHAVDVRVAGAATIDYIVKGSWWRHREQSKGRQGRSPQELLEAA